MLTGYEWQSLLTSHGMACSLSLRGNCHDNAATESFFPLQKREPIKHMVHANREDPRPDVFDHIELFRNPKQPHGNNCGLSPIQF